MPTPGPPSKGYRVHRSPSAKSPVADNTPTEQQHGSSVSKLLFCTDVLNCNRFLVDTGASVSIINYTPKPNEPYEEFLCQADGSPVKTYGTITKKISLGNKNSSRDYIHRFVKADVEGPVLGSDFLAEHNLLVDCRSGQLIPKEVHQSKSQQQPIFCKKISAEDAHAQISKVSCPEYLKPLISEFQTISGANFSTVTPKQEGARGDH